MYTEEIGWIASRDAIVSILRAVSGVGVIHTFPRLVDDKHAGRWKQLMVFKQESRINAWTVVRMDAVSSFLTNREVEVHQRVRIVGQLEHSDEGSSSDENDVLVDSVLQKFFRNYTLNSTVQIQGPASLVENAFEIVTNTIVHRVEIEFSLIQRVQVAIV